MRTQRIKLLPLMNPNFKILNSTYDLYELLNERPYVLVGEYPSERVVGYVMPNQEFKLKEDEIWGFIAVITDKTYEWTNAEIQVDIKEDNCRIATKITGIYVKEINECL